MPINTHGIQIIQKYRVAETQNKQLRSEINAVQTFMTSFVTDLDTPELSVPSGPLAEDLDGLVHVEAQQVGRVGVEFYHGPATGHGD